MNRWIEQSESHPIRFGQIGASCSLLHRHRVLCDVSESLVWSVYVALTLGCCLWLTSAPLSRAAFTPSAWNGMLTITALRFLWHIFSFANISVFGFCSSILQSLRSFYSTSRPGTTGRHFGCYSCRNWDGCGIYWVEAGDMASYPEGPSIAHKCHQWGLRSSM